MASARDDIALLWYSDPIKSEIKLTAFGFSPNVGVCGCQRHGRVVGLLPQIWRVNLDYSPKGLLGGLSIVLFGLIAATGGRIWIQNRIDISKSRNLITAVVTLVIGAGMTGNTSISLGNFSLGRSASRRWWRLSCARYCASAVHGQRRQWLLTRRWT